jgi:heme/copper-type cytochrome/quinol oxidase subunit 4
MSMSLTDPDSRNRKIGSFLQPIAWVLAILALGTSPFLVVIIESVPASQQIAAWVICMFSYIIGCIAFGLLLYYSSSHKNRLGITSYIFAYIAGLILILGSAKDKNTGLPDAFIPALVTYGIAAVLLVIYILHSVAAHQTLQDGVTTTATVTSAGINGMVNYVQHWKLTLKFTDQQGKDRWFHIGRTGLGYSVGQQFQIKYNPKKPGSRLGIVVLDG